MASYIALLRKERKSDYSVDFPDFPGCITAGKTLEEARTMAAEALVLHIEGLETVPSRRRTHATHHPMISPAAESEIFEESERGQLHNSSEPAFQG
jgi:predicted RNase H-like HicB family nuclease